MWNRMNSIAHTLTEKEVMNSSPIPSVPACNEVLLVEWVELEGDPKKPYCEPFDKDDRLNMDDLDWLDTDLV